MSYSIPVAYGLLILLAVGSLYFVALRGSLFRRDLRRDALERWAKSRSVVLTPEVERYRRRQATFSAIGLTQGIVTYNAIQLLVEPERSQPTYLLLYAVPLIGILVALQMAAEYTFRPRATGELRKAVISVRRLEDYVPRALLLANRSFGALPGALALASVVAGLQADRTMLVLAGIGAVVLAAVVELTQRWRVTWPRPFESAESTHVQDVLRSDGTRQALWGGVAGSVAALGSQFLVFAREAEGWLDWTGPLSIVPLVVVFILATVSERRGFDLGEARP